MVNNFPFPRVLNPALKSTALPSLAPTPFSSLTTYLPVEFADIFQESYYTPWDFLFPPAKTGWDAKLKAGVTRRRNPGISHIHLISDWLCFVFSFLKEKKKRWNGSITLQASKECQASWKYPNVPGGKSSHYWVCQDPRFARRHGLAWEHTGKCNLNGAEHIAISASCQMSSASNCICFVFWWPTWKHKRTFSCPHLLSVLA